MTGTTWTNVVADHKQQQALRIGRAAVELTLRGGLSAVSMSALAQAAGVSRATLYNYVPDVQTAIRRYLSAQAEAFTAHVTAAVAEEPDPEAKLRRYIREQVAYATGDDHRDAAALMDGGALGKPAHHSEGPRLLRDILREGVRAGVFGRVNIDTTALLVSRMLYAAHELIHDHKLGQRAVTDTITRLVLDGVRHNMS